MNLRTNRPQPTEQELAEMSKIELIQHTFREARQLEGQKQTAVARLLWELGQRVR